MDSSPKPPKTGVMIATPVRAWHGPHQFSQHFREQLERLAAMSESPECPYYFEFATIEGGIARARNVIAKRFLAGECKWLLPWDDDIVATADDVLRLLSHKRPFIGGLYTTRSDNPHWVANFMYEVELQVGCLLQVIELGTGFQLVHRQVFTELIRLYPQIAYVDRDTGEKMHAFYQQVAMTTDLKPDGDFLTEDYFFAHCCRHAGIGMFVDTTMKLKHADTDGTLYPAEWPPIPGVT